VNEMKIIEPRARRYPADKGQRAFESCFESVGQTLRRRRGLRAMATARSALRVYRGA